MASEILFVRKIKDTMTSGLQTQMRKQSFKKLTKITNGLKN